MLDRQGVTMTDHVVDAPPAAPAAVAAHDHAWRRVGKDQGRYGTVGEYRCDLCPAVWSM